MTILGGRVNHQCRSLGGVDTAWSLATALGSETKYLGRFAGQLLLMDEVSKYMVGPLSPYVRDFMDLTFKLETFVRENDKSLR